MKVLFGCALIACLVVLGCSGASPTFTPAPTVQELESRTSEPDSTATPTLSQVGTVTPTSESTTVPSGPTQTPSPAPTAPGPVIVGLSSASGQASPGHELTIDVNIDPQGRGISGVQVWIEYDPEIFQVIGAEPGDLLGGEPAQAGPIIDEVEGVFQYATARIGETHPPTSPGLFATIKLLVLDTGVAGRETFLKITEVKIPDQDIREIREVQIGEGLRLEVSP